MAEEDHNCGHCDHGHHRLEVDDLHVHYGKICALHGVGFATECGRSVALLGCNGAGKSTLLMALAGLLPTSSGSILWRGASPSKNPYEIAYLPQREEVDWDFPLTVRGLVEMGRYPHIGPWRRFSAGDHEAVGRAIDALDLGDLQDRHIRELSGGQQQRTFIARALAQEAHVLLLDEPFAGLDRPNTERLSELMGELSADGHLVIASHHDLDTVGELFDEVLMVNREQIAFGPVAETFTEENIRRAFASAEAA